MDQVTCHDRQPQPLSLTPRATKQPPWAVSGYSLSPISPFWSRFAFLLRGTGAPGRGGTKRHSVHVPLRQAEMGTWSPGKGSDRPSLLPPSAAPVPVR